MLAAALLTEGFEHIWNGECRRRRPREKRRSQEGFIPIFNGKDLTGWDGDHACGRSGTA